MKIVIAPDSFKESLSAEEYCQAIKAGFSAMFPDAHYICLPIADGDKGTVEAVVTTTGGNIMTLGVCGPMDRTVDAFYGLTGDGRTAVIEMTVASGLMLVAPEKRSPLLASSFSTRELVHHALDNGIRYIILGTGDSVTVDGGMGMTQALGVCFLDTDSQVLMINGGSLVHVANIEMDECGPHLANCHIGVACDVDNPLARARGAAAVFGPQKGATPEMVEEPEQELQNYARVLQQQTEINVCRTTGDGAAGDMDTATAVSLNTGIKPGIEIMLSAINLAQAVQSAALVTTGEGRVDSQATGDKAPLSMASAAKQFNAPVIGITGVLGDDVEVVHQHGIDAVFNISSRLAPLAEVLASGETNLFNSARNITCAVKIGQGIKD